MGRPTTIPRPAVSRLVTYLYILRSFTARGVVVASSGELATAAGVNPSILRKDLSYVGAVGVRGVGYDVSRLTARIKLALHTDSTNTVALAGAGRLGRALISHTGFGRGFTVAVLFDSDPEVVGSGFADDLVVAPLSEIEATLEGLGSGIDFGVIATADDDAQTACDAFVAGGISRLLNVTPVHLSVDSDVVVRQVDLALELQVLGFQAYAVHRADAPERIVPTTESNQAMGEEAVTA